MTESDQAEMMRDHTALAAQFHCEVTAALGNPAAYDAAVRRFKSGVVEIAKRYFPDPDFWPTALDTLLDYLADGQS